MAKFTTPYDTLLRVRRIEEDKAKAALASANHAHRSAQAGLESRREHFAQVSAVPDGEMDLSTFQRRLAHTRFAADGVGWGRAEVEKTGAARTAALEDTRIAAMRTQGLEKLVDRAKEARMDEMLAADQRTAEESMAGKRARRRAPSSAAQPTDVVPTVPTGPLPPSAAPARTTNAPVAREGDR